MRGAPPVHMACGPDARWRLSCRALWALAAATVVAWGSSHVGLSLAPSWVGIGLAVSAAWLLSAKWPGSTSVLHLVWDGQQWALQGQPGHVAVMLDFGFWLLLRFRPTGRPQWLAVNLHQCGAPPVLCRAALLAHAGRAADADRPAR